MAPRYLETINTPMNYSGESGPIVNEVIIIKLFNKIKVAVSSGIRRSVLQLISDCVSSVLGGGRAYNSGINSPNSIFWDKLRRQTFGHLPTIIHLY